MNDYYTFQLVSREGSVFSVDTPKGITNLDEAKATLSPYLAQAEVVSYEKKSGGLFW